MRYPKDAAEALAASLSESVYELSVTEKRKALLSIIVNGNHVAPKTRGAHNAMVAICAGCDLHIPNLMRFSITIGIHHYACFVMCPRCGNHTGWINKRAVWVCTSPRWLVWKNEGYWQIENAREETEEL